MAACARPPGSADRPCCDRFAATSRAAAGTSFPFGFHGYRSIPRALSSSGRAAQFRRAHAQFECAHRALAASTSRTLSGAIGRAVSFGCAAGGHGRFGTTAFADVDASASVGASPSRRLDGDAAFCSRCRSRTARTVFGGRPAAGADRDRTTARARARGVATAWCTTSRCTFDEPCRSRTHAGSSGARRSPAAGARGTQPGSARDCQQADASGAEHVCARSQQAIVSDASGCTCREREWSTVTARPQVT